MTELRSNRRISVSEASKPILPRHAKLKFDETRQRWVILAPERVLAPDDIAVEILQLCDGERNVADIIDLLVGEIRRAARRYRHRCSRDAAGSRRQGLSHASAGEDSMSPTLTDASPVFTDPADSLAIMERTRSTAETFGIPLAVLAELTHRCPLQCPYCSNPVELDRGSTELTTDEWKKVLSELAEIGVLQIHFSGGEPTARKDIVELVQHATDVGLYSNLITSAVLLTRDKLSALADAGLCHVQISFQGNEPVVADRVGGYRNGHAKKLEVARWTRELDLPLTVNAVMHRQNLHQLADIIQMAVDLDADRLEVANVQYYGWALKNRAALMPTIDQIDETSRIVEDAQASPEGHSRYRLCRPGLLRAAPEEMHGRLGPAVLQHLSSQARSCPAMPPRPSPGWNSNPCAPIIRSPGSGRTPKPSTAIAAPAGCPNRARAARSRKWISAAAAARPSR